MGRRVALVLSSGNARGFAHIGAIDALEERGYEITSVAGTSIGSLVGGIYATGQMADFKEWLYNLNRNKVISLLDPSLSSSHLLKGVRVLRAIMEVVPDRRIEDLRIPFCCVASDLNRMEEVVLNRGSLFKAIRASMSVPTLFQPVHRGSRTLLDGGSTNPLPLNRVKRHDGDLLVGIDVSAPNRRPLTPTEETDVEGNRYTPDFLTKLFASSRPHQPSTNYASLLSQAFSTMIAQNTALMKQLVPPDIMLSIQENELPSFDYEHAMDIAHEGYIRMLQVLDDYEKNNNKEKSVKK